jgi:hypothetical protein
LFHVELAGVHEYPRRNSDRRGEFLHRVVQHVADEAEQRAAEKRLALQGVTDRFDELGRESGDEDRYQQDTGHHRFETLLIAPQSLCDPALGRTAGPFGHARPPSGTGLMGRHAPMEVPASVLPWSP